MYKEKLKPRSSMSFKSFLELRQKQKGRSAYELMKAAADEQLAKDMDQESIERHQIKP